MVAKSPIIHRKLSVNVLNMNNGTIWDNCTAQTKLNPGYWPNTCFKDEVSHIRLTVHASAIETFTRRYIFPIQFLVGVVGNTLNLLCFSSSGMRTKTNLFLSFMAMADLLFLLCNFPINLIGYDAFIDSKSYVRFYYQSHPTFITLCKFLRQSYLKI